MKNMIYPKRTKYRQFRKGCCRAGRLLYRAIEAARRATTGQFQRIGKIRVRVLNLLIVLNLFFYFFLMKMLTRAILYFLMKVLLLLIFGSLADPWQIGQNVIPSAGGGNVVIYEAPSPGGPVEILEIPPTPPQDQAVEILEVPPTPPQDQAVEILEVPPTPPQDQAVEAQGPDLKPNRNLSLESSIRGRIRTLEREHSMFLLSKENGEYWRDIKASLEGIKSPIEYANLLDFECRDLSIRELRHACVRIMEEELNFLGSSAAYIDYYPYFEDKRLDLESALKLTRGEDMISPKIADHAEIQFLQKELEHLRKYRSKSPFFTIFREEYL